jgi:hypothetical protein
LALIPLTDFPASAQLRHSMPWQCRGINSIPFVGTTDRSCRKLLSDGAAPDSVMPMTPTSKPAKPRKSSGATRTPATQENPATGLQSWPDGAGPEPSADAMEAGRIEQDEQDKYGIGPRPVLLLGRATGYTVRAGADGKPVIAPKRGGGRPAKVTIRNVVRNAVGVESDYVRQGERMNGIYHTTVRLPENREKMANTRRAKGAATRAEVEQAEVDNDRAVGKAVTIAEAVHAYATKKVRATAVAKAKIKTKAAKKVSAASERQRRRILNGK